MASGGESHCKLVGNEKLQSEIVQLLCSWLEAQALGEQGLGMVDGLTSTLETAKKDIGGCRGSG